MDIIEKLRKWPCDQEPFTHNHKDCQCRVTRAAADEIERLREKVLFAEQWATGLPRFVNDPAHRALIDEIRAFTKELKG